MSKAHFLNVGCADCTIFEINGDNEDYCIMVDCGYRRTGNKVYKPTNIYNYLLNEIGTMYIDLLIITHPHHDHYIGMHDLLLGGITVGEFWGSPYKRRYGDNSLSLEDLKEYNNLKAKLVPNNNNRYVVSKSVKKTFSNCNFTILGPRKVISSIPTRECHDACLVVWASTPSNSILICGDASDSELEQIRSDWKLGSCLILRASHHGSINGADLKFIKEVSPLETIISTKSKIFQNLPSAFAMQRYRSKSTFVRRTDLNGTRIAKL